MDSLKKYGAALKKHHFWVLMGLVVVIALVGWNSATADLKQQKEDQVRQIQNRFANLDPYLYGNPANEEFAEEVRTLATSLEGQVFDAWGLMAEDQSGILKWPQTVAAIGELAPGSEIPEPLRADYRNLVIESEWDRLFELLDLRRRKGAAAGAPAPAVGPGGQPVPVQLEGVLVWEQRFRDALVNRYLTNTTPSSLRVRLTQEDLWCFESLFRVIQHMNAKATDPLNAVIKRIDSLDVGQYATREAARTPGKIWLAPDATLEIRSGGAISGLTAEDSYTDDQKLLHGRYLDENNQPVPVEMYESSPPFAEFKQMFVQMKFLMDQRALPQLLAACANSPLPIEVRQVRMNLDQVDLPRGANQARVGVVGGAETQVERAPYDVEVEVRGIIFIYNNPDKEALGSGAAENPAQRAFGIPLPSEDL